MKETELRRRQSFKRALKKLQDMNRPDKGKEKALVETSLVVQWLRLHAPHAGDLGLSLSQEDHVEAGTATHSSVLSWRIPGMGEPGGLPSMGSHRVRHD